jgi:hypothetical protein
MGLLVGRLILLARSQLGLTVAAQVSTLVGTAVQVERLALVRGILEAQVEQIRL